MTTSGRGPSVRLTAIPLKSLDYSLNKKQFIDAIWIRYWWEIPELPKTGVCLTRNIIEHTLDCKREGDVSLRHNDRGDTEAQLPKAIILALEPELQDITENIQLSPGSNLASDARLDISARGVFSRRDIMFFNVRITKTNSNTNRNKSLQHT